MTSNAADTFTVDSLQTFQATKKRFSFTNRHTATKSDDDRTTEEEVTVSDDEVCIVSPPKKQNGPKGSAVLRQENKKQSSTSSLESTKSQHKKHKLRWHFFFEQFEHEFKFFYWLYILWM